MSDSCYRSEIFLALRPSASGMWPRTERSPSFVELMVIKFSRNECLCFKRKKKTGWLNQVYFIDTSVRYIYY